MSRKIMGYPLTEEFIYLTGVKKFGIMYCGGLFYKRRKDMKDHFNTVVGNKALCRRLADDVISSKLPHAIILEGPHGTGKHTISRLTAAALSCENKSTSAALPCLTCLSCRKALEHKSPDIIVVGREDKATIGVDAVRFIKEDVSIVPNDSDNKVYIIEDADKMTTQAQNALLLTLEEPPAYVHFFLLCENSGLLLETIRSRAPVLRTELLSREDIDNYISSTDRRAAQMKLSDPRTYRELLMASGYGIGRALEFLDPKVFSPVMQMRTLANDLITIAIRPTSAQNALQLLSRFPAKRDQLSQQLSMVTDALRDLTVLKKSDDAPLCFYADRERAMELSDEASSGFLFKVYEALCETQDEISQNANVKLCLTKLATKIGILD